MRINHNIPALNSYRNLGTANSSNAKSMEKLSSGLRINRAADDAAGLAISETMRGQIKGLNQASRNSQDAISLLQTAEGGLTETNSILTRMRELSVQASNDTYTANDRQEMQKEIDQLKDEVDRIANTTSFNNKNLLDGTASAITSTDKTSTKVIMRGSLRVVDQFGVKSSGGGNYNLSITASAGTAQVQVSNVLKDTTTGNVAGTTTELSNIDKLWDASGKFMLNDPQTITLVQGNGNKASVTLFNTDTIADVVTKLNDAVSKGLKQGDLVSAGDVGNFVSFVTAAAPNTPEATQGTFVIRSAQAGQDGVINVIGSEQLVNALGFSTTVKASESTFTVDVTNAKDGSAVASNVKVSGNTLIGVVHKNVDVKFDSNAGIQATFNSTSHVFSLNAAAAHTTSVHLVDNSQVFQIGANEMQDMGAAIGRMDSEALGVNNILVTDRSSASRAITTIDNAISRVSAQRSSIGAVQNRLEHTINNLGVASENLTAAESRIRDVDMAAEMMEFSKTNILSQAATAMLAQANKQPQSVLQLLQ